jgi:asparagine synthase (glutamine-hydrolysing)
VGFTVPLTRWFAGPLAGLLRDVLLSERALARGYFRPDSVHGIINEHLGGRVDHEQELWLLLTLELWHRLFVDDDGTEDAIQRVTDEFMRSLATAA